MPYLDIISRIKSDLKFQLLPIKYLVNIR